MIDQYEKERKVFHSLSIPERMEFIKSLPPDAFRNFRYFSDIILISNQLIAPGDCRYWFFCGGRGTGKTKVGGVEIRKRALAGQEGMMVVAPTFVDLNETIVPAILAEFPEDLKPEYIAGKKIIRCKSGLEIMCKTTQQGEIRGKNTTFAWLDEIVIGWDGLPDKQMDMFKILDANVRISPAQMLLTTTGAPTKFFRYFFDLQKKYPELIKITSGAMYENDYLDKQTKKSFSLQWEGTRYARQELEGQVDFTIDGALWNPELINKTRRGPTIEEIANPPNPNNMKKYRHCYDFFQKFMIGADPATTSHANSDAWGICVAGLGKDNHVYILADHSKVMSPNDAAEKIAALHKEYRNAQIVAESNQGGDMITYILRTKMPNVLPKLVHVHQNKMSRLQPVVVLWDQNRAHLVGKFEQLEIEMCEFTGAEDQKSPNRLDAMGLAVHYLLLEPNLKPFSGYQPTFR